jgi:aminomethyltransferase
MTEGEFQPPGRLTHATLSIKPGRVKYKGTQSMSTDDTRHSPLHETHARLGANFIDFAGWNMPARYSSDLAEHHAVRKTAGLFDLTHMAEIIIIGPEAGQALDYAFAGTLSTIEHGRAKYSLLLGRNGGILDDVVIYRTGEDRYMVVANAANREIVVHELRDRTAFFNTEVFDETDNIALIAVQGPNATTILTGMGGFSLEDGLRDGEDFADRLHNLRYYRSVSGYFHDTAVLIARTGYTGEDGFELYTSPDIATLLWDAITETGTPLGLMPAGLASRDTLRLEAGMPLYGHELTATTFPSQAGLGRVVDLSKPGEFVGRQASETGPLMGAPMLVGLTGITRQAARVGYNVFSDTVATKPSGTITSGALSPTLGIPIAMAYVTPSLATPGTELSVDIRGKRVPFNVTELPFYNRKKNSP